MVLPGDPPKLEEKVLLVLLPDCDYMHKRLTSGVTFISSLEHCFEIIFIPGKSPPPRAHGTLQQYLQ